MVLSSGDVSAAYSPGEDRGDRDPEPRARRRIDDGVAFIKAKYGVTCPSPCGVPIGRTWPIPAISAPAGSRTAKSGAELCLILHRSLLDAMVKDLARQAIATGMPTYLVADQQAVPRQIRAVGPHTK